MDALGGYFCNCDPGWTGDQCDGTAALCATNPCDAELAQCIGDGAGGSSCTCNYGYETTDAGATCTEILECASAPCENGAACAENIGSYRCTGMPGFADGNCETDVNECLSMMCANGAACVEGVDSYRCECDDGFTGEHCESDVDECEARPCLNDGTCFESGLAGFVAAGSRLCWRRQGEVQGFLGAGR